MKTSSIQSKIGSAISTAGKSFFLDKNGNLVLIQFPNAPLWSALFFYALSFITEIPIWNIELTPYLTFISFWGTCISLLYWAFLEITSGDTPFRKVLGLAIFIGQVLSIYNYFF